MTTTMKTVASMTITAAVTATEYFKPKTGFLQAERHYFSVSFFVQNDKMQNLSYVNFIKMKKKLQNLRKLMIFYADLLMDIIKRRKDVVKM